MLNLTFPILSVKSPSGSTLTGVDRGGVAACVGQVYKEELNSCAKQVQGW